MTGQYSYYYHATEETAGIRLTLFSFQYQSRPEPAFTMGLPYFVTDHCVTSVLSYNYLMTFNPLFSDMQTYIQ